MIPDVLLTPLLAIEMPGGGILRALKQSEKGYSGFGEAYFSQVDKGMIKAWKRHKKMKLNLIVPIGEIKFVLFDNREPNKELFQEVILSKDNYCRLTIPPMIWVGFQGVHLNESIILNIANIEHQSAEVDKKELNEINYDWGINL